MAEYVIQSTKQPTDLGDIQNKLDNAKNGDIIWLMGTFDFGIGDVLFLRNKAAHLDLRGGDGGAVIKNAIIKWGIAGAGSSVPVSASVKGITFDGFSGTGIQVGGTIGENRIEQCTFRNYRYKDAAAGAWPIRVEPPGADKLKLDPRQLTGTLAIVGCVFEPPDYASVPLTPGGMNNLLHLNNGNLDLLQITDNEIQDMSWIGLAVWGIKGRTEIVHNRVTLSPPENQAYKVGEGVISAGIVFGMRPGSYEMNRDGSVLIERNTVTINRVDAAGVEVFLYSDDQYIEPVPPGPAREVTIRDNVVHMMNGNNNGAALACLGGCSNSSWTGNVITGAGRQGILVSQDSQEAVPAGQLPKWGVSNAAPSYNTFSENQFAGGKFTDPIDGQSRPFGDFTASQAQVFVDTTVAHLDLRQNTFGPVSGSNDWPLEFVTPLRAGIDCYGSDGTIALNDFSKSHIQGWFGSTGAQGPDHVGSIYLAQSSRRNHIEYTDGDFPGATAHPPQRQIHDEGPKEALQGANTIEELAPV